MTDPRLAYNGPDGNRYYRNPITGTDGYLSVSAIKGALDTGPGLIKWTAKLCAEYAVDNEAGWKQQPTREDSIRIISRAGERERDRTARRGSNIHGIAEDIARGKPIDEAQLAWLPADHGPYITALRAFLGEWGPTFHHAELTVFNDEHRYAGTLDALADLPGVGTVVLDYKTGSVWGDQALQLAAYRYADYGVHPSTLGPVRVTLPPIAGAAVVQLRPDGTYDVIPMDTSAAVHDAFVSLIPMVRIQKATRSWVLPPIAPPRSLTAERAALTLARLRNLPPTQQQQVKAWWPAGVPGFGGTNRAHTAHELDAIEALLVSAERECEQPFAVERPTPTPAAVVTDMAGDTGGPIDPEERAAIVARLLALPDGLRAAVQRDAAVQHATALKTANQGAILDRLLAAAETIHGHETAAWAATRAAIGDDDVANHIWSIAVDAEHRQAYADTLLAGVLPLTFTEDQDGRVGPVLGPMTEAALIDRHGNKTAARKAAEPYCPKLGITLPRSASAVAANTALAVLAWAHQPQTGEAS